MSAPETSLASSFAKWCETNQAIANYFMIEEFENETRQDSIQQKQKKKETFLLKRTKIHAQQLNDLISFGNRIQRNLVLITKEIERISNIEIPTTVYPIYEKLAENFSLRKLCFTEHEIKRSKIELLNFRFSKFADFANLSNETMIFFRNINQIVPQNTIVQINESFYSLKNVEIDSLPKVNNINRLIIYAQTLKKQIERFEKPKWIHNFSGYLETIVKDSVQNIEKETNYIPPQDCEISLSRCLLNRHSKFLPKIDKFISTFPTMQPEKFVNELIKFGRELVSPYSKALKKPAECSVLLTFIFRILFARIYEKYESFFTSKNPDREAISIIHSLKMGFMDDWPIEFLPVRQISALSSKDNLNLDPEINPKIEKIVKINENRNILQSEQINSQILPLNNSISNPLNSKTLSSKSDNEDNKELKELNKDKSVSYKGANSSKLTKCECVYLHDELVRDVFLNDNEFGNAAKLLTQASFCSNPIDALSIVQKAIDQIQNGAVEHKISRGLVSPEEAERVICFDDLFSLLFGTLAASDVPDLFQLNWFVQAYAPQDNLSAPLDFARANIEGLATHVSTLREKLCQNSPSNSI
ncbi:hypothetical protein TRFO_31151 [Tritrichomonas foetus]|uniref:VPS9 domain-containing protein n=1 Tax=Tritrichomonas foetus TaxID=1144522 RepID=A0A1J4JS06_9EUKA|nr:hypothetical protein TRFO_31151 [Tritrichomonas foetus]|eukprot:OHT01913.1 hypothetical protein TRFO_31151 [Tritrichomonas foetus]